MEFGYTLEALFAAARITFWFLLLFGVIAPLFLEHTRNLPPIEKLIYSWIGLGGVIVVSIFVLTLFNLYDFISIVLTLLLIPLIRSIWRNRNKGIWAYIKRIEFKAVLAQIRSIERSHGYGWQALKTKLFRKRKISSFRPSETFLAITIAIFGGLLRMYPALTNAAPFSRSWYFQLNRIKNIRLQDYFSGYPDPAGMHSLVSLFSMLTQVSPEMILHLLGSLSSFFLCIIIYWALKDLTRNTYPRAPIFGMAIYAVIPTLFLPVSLDIQIEANSLDLALCFALPTITIFVRNLRAKYKSPWFYVLAGFVATGMVDLFVAFAVLLPALLIGLLTLPRRRYFKSLRRLLVYIGSMTLVILAPFVVYSLYQGVDFLNFFRNQLFDVEAYSYYPNLLYPIDELSIWFLGISCFLIFSYLIRQTFFKHKIKHRGDELFFLIIFASLTLVYIPYFNIGNVWVDADQLTGFYSFFICLFAGILFISVIRFIKFIFSLQGAILKWVERGLLAITLAFFIYLRGGIEVSRLLPDTLPNGFFQAYYKIIDERLPYTYATVSPELDRALAKNRHYFMNYEYFLSQYGSIDSLYREQLELPEEERQGSAIPPASIFVFTENPPYGSIQQGILFNTQLVMRDIRQWIEAYSELRDRTVRIYHRSEDATVYEIVNREEESRISDVLLNIYPKTTK